MYLADVFFLNNLHCIQVIHSISSKACELLFISGRFVSDYFVCISSAAYATVLKNFSLDMIHPLERSIINPNENRKHLAHVLNLPSPSLPMGVRLLLLPLCCDTGWTQRSVSCLMPLAHFWGFTGNNKGLVSWKTLQLSPNFHKWKCTWSYHAFKYFSVKQIQVTVSGALLKYQEKYW